MLNAYQNLLSMVGLFKGIDDADLKTMLGCLRSEVKTFGKDEILLLAGSKPEAVGIVLAGQLHVIREDADGNRTIVTAVNPGDIFGEALCCAGVEESPVTVQADIDSVVLLMHFPRMLHICPNACAFHSTLIGNMLELIARKNLLLQNRMEIICLKSVRAKVVRYLEAFVSEHGRAFTIPFNREELADFLCVERSALSHELARMKKDGLIEYKKNKFMVH